MEIDIRHAEPDDYDAIHRILNGPRAIEGTLQLPLYSVESRRKWLSELSAGDTVLVASVDGETVGNLDLRTYPTLWRRRHVGEIGMAVHDDWHGRGVGTALMRAALDLADNWLNLTRVELTVFADNAAGIALYEKFGFGREGTHRNFAFRNGEYADALSMARLKA